MSAHSNDSNVYKPKFTGFLIAAIALILLVIVVLVSTILLVTSTTNGDDAQTSGSTETQAPASSSSVETSAESNAPESSADPNQTLLPEVSDSPDTPTQPTREPPKVSPTETTLTLPADAVNEGSLLLLDADHLYQKDPSLLISRTAMGKLSAEKLLEEYGFALVSGTTGNYTVAGSNRFINSDALYYFNEMTADFVKESGNKDVQVRNGYYYSGENADTESMEHSTGFYIDLQIYRTNGTYPLNYEPLKTQYYDWFVNNCWKYGFVHVRDTGSYSTFRFLGAAHTAVMNKYGFDLSQYISSIAVYTYDSRMRVTDGFGWEWWIYYVKANNESTPIPVIGTKESYRISGNNVNGYIVAINSSCFA